MNSEDITGTGVPAKRRAAQECHENLLDVGRASRERRRAHLAPLSLPDDATAEIVDLWDEYEAAVSPEARLAKALDKLETIMQHNQGRNPGTFDYAFNLDYGAKSTANHPLIVEIRRILDTETAALAEATRQD